MSEMIEAKTAITRLFVLLALLSLPRDWDGMRDELEDINSSLKNARDRQKAVNK